MSKHQECVCVSVATCWYKYGLKCVKITSMYIYICVCVYMYQYTYRQHWSNKCPLNSRRLTIDSPSLTQQHLNISLLISGTGLWEPHEDRVPPRVSQFQRNQGQFACKFAAGEHHKHPNAILLSSYPLLNGNFRILKWRYCTIFQAIFCGDIPLHRPKK